MKLHAGYMEIAVANLIGWRQNTIVSNVSWGLGLNHECDMLVLDQNQRFTEIEIKISKSDLKKDFKKPHNHSSTFISRLVYAVPAELVEYALSIIPDGTGLIQVWHNDDDDGIHCSAQWVRRCRYDPRKQNPNQGTINKFYHLGCMRIWSLKQHRIENRFSYERARQITGVEIVTKQK